MKSLGTSNIRSSLLVGLLVAWVISAPNIPTCCEEFRGGLIPSYDQLAIVDNNWHRQRQTHTQTRRTDSQSAFGNLTAHQSIPTLNLHASLTQIDYYALPDLPFLSGWIAGVVVYVCVPVAWHSKSVHMPYSTKTCQTMSPVPQAMLPRQCSPPQSSPRRHTMDFDKNIQKQ